MFVPILKPNKKRDHQEAQQEIEQGGIDNKYTKKYQAIALQPRVNMDAAVGEH